MKLIKCHIENFGKLSGVDYDFTDNITEFCEDNGFGKSTLAAFIKAMFYGLPSLRENSGFNDRKHYYPFDGKKFGGYLTFETEGKEYRITRYFDKKSEKKDELNITCGKSGYDGFGTDVGRAVFGVDKDSFERTIFITSDSIEMGATSSISAKLTGFVENTDGSTFDDACKRLTSAKKRLKLDRGEGGLIREKDGEIRNLNAEIYNIEDISKALGEKYERANGLKRAIEEGEEKVKKIESANLELERWEQYENMTSRLCEDEQALEKVRSKYPKGIPTLGEIEKMCKLSSNMIALEGKKVAVRFDDEKKARLEELSEAFSGGTPSEEELKSLQNDINRISELRVHLDRRSHTVKSDRATELERKFSGGVPDKADTDKVKGDVEQYRQLDVWLKEQSDMSAASVPVKKNKPTVFIIAAIVAAVVAVVGIALLAASVSAVAGGILLGVGAAALAAVALMYVVGRKNAAPLPIAIDSRAVDCKRDMKLIEERVRTFLVPYGYYTQNGIVFDFASFETDLREYLRNREAEGVGEREKLDKQAEMDSLTEKVSEILKRYGVGGDDLQQAFVSLQMNIAEYAKLVKDSENADSARSQAAEEIKNSSESVQKIVSPYGIELKENLAEQADELYKDAEAAGRLEKAVEEKKKEIDGYKRKYGLSVKPAVEKTDTAELESKLSDCRKELAALVGQIAEDESMVEQLPDKYAVLHEAEEELLSLKNKYAMLDAALKLLREAEGNLKDRYVNPIKDNFLYYANMIERTLGEKVEISEDFSITFEHGGEARSDKHLSAGQRSVCSLCFRLALINNMYPAEKPFIIMDDPFVSLDESHMRKTVTAVKELSEDNQIIYFCCHDSRRIVGA